MYSGRSIPAEFDALEARGYVQWAMPMSRGVMRYAHDLPRSPYHRVGQVAQTVDQNQRRDNP